MARWGFLIVALLVSIAACEQREAEETGATTETATADQAQVEESIRAAQDRFVQAGLSGDIETMLSVYTPDAIMQAPGMPRAERTDAIRLVLQQLLAGGKPTAFSIESQKIVVAESGEMAYELGTYSYTGPAPDGSTITDNGKHLLIWTPTAGGEWKAAIDTWNSDAMPGAAASETQPARPETPTGE